MAAGMFAAGIIYTICCFLFLQLPLLWEEHSSLMTLMVVLLLAGVVMYIRLMLGDPGTKCVASYSELSMTWC